MPRCVDCRSYPWLPDVDPSMLPSMQCDAGPRRWTRDSARVGNSCQHFSVKKAMVSEEAVADESWREATVGKELTAESAIEADHELSTVSPDDYTAQELREKAESLGFTGTSRMNKTQLAEAINAALAVQKG